jgi:hypothetical protein
MAAGRNGLQQRRLMLTLLAVAVLAVAILVIAWNCSTAIQQYSQYRAVSSWTGATYVDADVGCMVIRPHFWKDAA